MKDGKIMQNKNKSPAPKRRAKVKLKFNVSVRAMNDGFGGREPFFVELYLFPLFDGAFEIYII